MTKGVVLLAFGKIEYLYMASHLVASIKHFNKDVPVTIIHDGQIAKIPQAWHLWDDEIQMNPKDYVKNYKIDPGFAKINLIKYLPYDRNVYLDVDGLAIKDISPLLEIEGFYSTIVVGKGKFEDDINYTWWASNENIWKFFNLDKDQEYCSIQSSFAVFEKGEKLDELYDRLLHNFEFPMMELQNQWGGTMPDELIFGGSIAQMKHDPDCGEQVVFFGHKLHKLSLSEIEDSFYILSLYGNGKGNPLVKLRYREWYDRLMAKIGRELGLYPLGKVLTLTRTKHANR